MVSKRDNFWFAVACSVSDLVIFFFSIGPVGSAICVYDAENTRNPMTGTGGFGQGIFDVFRGDLLVNGIEQENTFMEVGYVHVYNFVHRINVPYKVTC